MRAISLHCFGIGDGWPCGDRSHSSFLYHFGKVNLLIDCSEPVSRHFKNTGLKYDAIDRIFISHLHCDHIESDPVRIAHSADLGAVEDLAPLVEKPLDLLVCELAHFKPKDLFLYLQGREIKRIVFIHVSRRHREALPKTEALARKILGKIPFSFARDGEKITL